jgi:hypothetical protein
MLDLETLGTTPGCAIISIGAIAFDPLADTLDEAFEDDGFYSVVSRDSCTDAMLHIDAETAQWWARQSDDARKVVQDSANSTAPTLVEALDGLVTYVAGHHTPSKALLWGNGADFDNPILTVAARHAGIELPWKWGSRCYRTVKNLHEFLQPDFAAPPLVRVGTYHNALDDARSQALHMWDLLNTFRNRS